ncbi:hypothetical protein ACFX2I_014614 [Malus domestica]
MCLLPIMPSDSSHRELGLRGTIVYQRFLKTERCGSSRLIHHLYSTETPPLVNEQQLQLCHAIAITLLSDDAGKHHLSMPAAAPPHLLSSFYAIASLVVKLGVWPLLSSSL